MISTNVNIQNLYRLKEYYQVKHSWFQNVYPYITEECQLHCEHCYLGERLIRGSTMSIDQAIFNLKTWRELGGKKLCFLGGEPTLHPRFEELVRYANILGYEKIILDTNGLQVALEKLSRINCSELTYIQISLDGFSSQIHEQIRGQETFKTVINTIDELCNKGFDTRIICTVNKINQKDCINILSVADKLGVSLVKYHIFSGIGKGKKNAEWVLDPYEWIDFTEMLLEFKGKYKTKIQYQPAYARKKAMHKYIDEGYYGCVGKNLERVSIFPDGKVYVCSYLFDNTSLNFANIGDCQIKINEGFNELDLFMKLDDCCNNCAFIDICMGGCPAEKLITGFLPCKEYANIFPVCRLWKSTV